jgi:hypothetical protein
VLQNVQEGDEVELLRTILDDIGEEPHEHFVKPVVNASCRDVVLHRVDAEDRRPTTQAFAKCQTESARTASDVQHHVRSRGDERCNFSARVFAVDRLLGRMGHDVSLGEGAGAAPAAPPASAGTMTLNTASIWSAQARAAVVPRRYGSTTSRFMPSGGRTA